MIEFEPGWSFHFVGWLFLNLVYQRQNRPILAPEIIILSMRLSLMDNFAILQNAFGFWIYSGFIKKNQQQKLGILRLERGGKIKHWVINGAKLCHQYGNEKQDKKEKPQVNFSNVNNLICLPTTTAFCSRMKTEDQRRVKAVNNPLYLLLKGYQYRKLEKKTSSNLFFKNKQVDFRNLTCFLGDFIGCPYRLTG